VGGRALDERASGGWFGGSRSSSNHNSSRASSNCRHGLPVIVAKEMELLEKAAYDKLVAGAQATVRSRTSNFDVLSIIYTSLVGFQHTTDGNGQNSKWFLGVNAIPHMGKEFIVYAGGNNNEVMFEKEMAALGANVFSFDCTVKENPAWKTFKFYPWCIGRKETIGNEVGYVKSGRTGMSEDQFVFKLLKQICRDLGHDRIHMLKMDIEGFEWGILQEEIIKDDDADLPEQLLIEIHTQGANPKYVPKHISTGKDSIYVAKVFLELFRRGYRLQNFERNSGDGNCAEVSFIRVF
jgi:hypothetical protein